jgi:hypothetical protein
MEEKPFMTQTSPFASPIDVLNYALTLEHLEATFYREGVAMFDAAAYEAIGLIDSDDLLTAALTIHGVEARHAAYLNLIDGTSPFPDAVNPTLTYDEVIALVTPFIVG